MRTSNVLNENVYYIYSKEEDKYIFKTPEEISELINSIGKDKLNIIGAFDHFKPRDIRALDLER